jgi:hypothetical protein
LVIYKLQITAILVVNFAFGDEHYSKK